MKVEQFEAKNQFHLYGEGKHILQSYDSKVIVIQGDSIILGRDWDYSRTTSKYVYLFLEYYGYINFWNISNKKKYINDLIKEGKIKYDENMY